MTSTKRHRHPTPKKTIPPTKEAEDDEDDVEVVGDAIADGQTSSQRLQNTPLMILRPLSLTSMMT